MIPVKRLLLLFVLALGFDFGRPLGAATSAVVDLDGGPVSGRWQVRSDDRNLLGTAPVLEGAEGLWLLKDAPADGAWTVRLRFDALRASVDTPASGIVLNFRDARNHDRVFVESRSGRLVYQRFAQGRPSTLAAADVPFRAELGDWFWLRVRREGDRVSAAVSPDGFDWSIAVEVTAGPGAGGIGLVADSPATLFSLGGAIGPEPAKLEAVSYRGEFIQHTATDRRAGVQALVRVRDGATPLALEFTCGTDRRTYPLAALRAGMVRIALEHATLAGGEEATLALRVGDRVVETKTFRWPTPEALAKRVPAWLASTPPTTVRRADYLAAMKRVEAAWQAGAPGRNEFAIYGPLAQYRAAPTPEVRSVIAAQAKQIMEVFERRGTVPHGFSSLLPSMQVLRIARDERLLPPEAVARIPALAAAALQQSDYERGPMNRALGLVAGIGPALALTADFPRAADVRRIRDLVEQDLAGNGYEPLEDATNYQLLSLFFILEWSRDTGRAELIEQPGFHDRFEHLLAEISPLGTLPAYGDDVHGQPGMLIGLFERVAALWHDGRYRWAAQRIFQRHFGDGALPDGLLGQDFSGLAIAAAVADETLAPVAPPAGIRVLARHDATPDKLVLRGGNDPGDLYALVDLVNGYEHGHADALAVVGLTGGGRILLDGAGRYARGVTFQNLPQLASEPADYPLHRGVSEQGRRMRDALVATGAWRTYRLPLRRYWIWGNFSGDTGMPRLDPDHYHPDIDARFAYDPARQSVILLELKGRGAARLDTRGMRLSGRAGTREVAFPTHVASALGLDSRYEGVVLDTPLDLKTDAYSWLEFEARVEVDPAPGNEVYVQSIVIGDVDGCPKRFLEANATAGDVVVRNVMTQSWGSSADLAMDTLTPSGEPARLHRQIALLGNRLLWVRDRIEARGQRPLTAGPTWHLTDATLDDAGVLSPSTGLRIAFAGAGELRRHSVYGITAPYLYAHGETIDPGATRTFDSWLWLDEAGPAPTWRRESDGSTTVEIKGVGRFVAPATPAADEPWLHAAR